MIEFADQGIDTVHSLLQSTTLSANVENLLMIGTGPSQGFGNAQESAVGSFDRIMDFVRGEDLIDLSGIDAHAGAAGNQNFHFTGAQPFFGSEGDLWTRSTFLGAMVEGDVNGDGSADFAILVTGVWGLEASDFVL